MLENIFISHAPKCAALLVLEALYGFVGTILFGFFVPSQIPYVVLATRIRELAILLDFRNFSQTLIRVVLLHIILSVFHSCFDVAWTEEVTVIRLVLVEIGIINVFGTFLALLGSRQYKQPVGYSICRAPLPTMRTTVANRRILSLEALSWNRSGRYQTSVVFTLL